jgi:hypothetical protein
MNKLFFAAASVLALCLGGCAAETSSPDSESSVDALRTSSAAVVGELARCGGNSRYAPVCDTGLKCQIGVPGVPFSTGDTGGVCVKMAWGDHCGGNIATAATCPTNLECVLDVTRPNSGDTGGSCGYASYGEACLGFNAQRVECNPGLQCSHVDANGVRINPDRPGVCLQGPNQECGGNMTNAKACAGGLTCTSQSGLPVGDVGGLCK